MTTPNPLFPEHRDPQKKEESGFLLPKTQEQMIQPINAKAKDDGRDAAANLIRQKVAEAYASEPSAAEEIEDIEEQKPKKLSKHQAYLSELQASGASVVEVQTKWHEYYAALSEDEKHEVWREFYAGQGDHTQSHAAETKSKPKVTAVTGHVRPRDIATPSARGKRLRDARTTREIKESIKHKVSAGGALKTKHHVQSLLVGLGAGVATLLILLFGLFNEMVIAPFIQPSRSVSSTPIIMSNASLAADGQSKVIIPKINVEIPVDYTVASLDEQAIQQGLEEAVVHYPNTVLPGEQGNAAIFGHSSNNIFNPGKYKFAFVLLSKLNDGDMFYLTKDGSTYAYRVFKKQVVNPSDTWVLESVEGKTATAVLITCDPPGTTKHRLVVWGEQISPDAATAAAPSQVSQTPLATTAELPGQAPSLWSRFVDWIF